MQNIYEFVCRILIALPALALKTFIQMQRSSIITVCVWFFVASQTFIFF